MLDVLVPLYRVQPNIRLYQKSPEVCFHYRFSFSDALIIAAATEAGCKTLYSEDLQQGPRIEGVTITNPFRT